VLAWLNRTRPQNWLLAGLAPVTGRFPSAASHWFGHDLLVAAQAGSPLTFQIIMVMRYTHMGIINLRFRISTCRASSADHPDRQPQLRSVIWDNAAASSSQGHSADVASSYQPECCGLPLAKGATVSATVDQPRAASLSCLTVCIAKYRQARPVWMWVVRVNGSWQWLRASNSVETSAL
jgi:hypothetical protein